MAACCASLSNLFFRMNADNRPSTHSPACFLVFYYLSSFIISLVAYPPMWAVGVNVPILIIGSIVGILNSTLMSLIFQALKRGPAGLTFAFQNAGAIFPGLIMFLLLGSDFGFSCSLTQLFGMILVLAGLFLDAKKKSADQHKPSSKWFSYALAALAIQIVALCCIQGRCLLFGRDGTGGFLGDFTLTEADDAWFMPGQFGASFLMQLFVFFQKKPSFQKKELYYGIGGGIGNFGSTWLLLLATQFATPFQEGIIFPCFAVTSMVLCNIWSNKLYQEPLVLKTNALCALGIFVASSG